jgi:hypothetical protein
MSWNRHYLHHTPNMPGWSRETSGRKNGKGEQLPRASEESRRQPGQINRRTYQAVWLGFYLAICRASNESPSLGESFTQSPAVASPIVDDELAAVVFVDRSGS